MARQAMAGGSHENSTVYRIAVTPHPTAQPLCTVPTALPRCSARMVSPISTEPTAHSPPKPRPCNPRVTSSCQKEWVNPLRKVNTANQAIVICRILTRPKRSASTPAIHPPTAEISRAAVPSKPACPGLMCQAATRLGITKLYAITSMPSRAQPPKVATSVLRSVGESWVIHAACDPARVGSAPAGPACGFIMLLFYYIMRIHYADSATEFTTVHGSPALVTFRTARAPRSGLQYRVGQIMRRRSTPSARRQIMGTVVLDKKADLAGPGIGDYKELEKILPHDYRSLLTPKETQQAIFHVKRYIEDNLCKELNLFMVEVPLIVDVESGVNDMLDRDGSRTPIQFHISND